MTRMPEPDCAVMCNLINIHTTYIHTYAVLKKYSQYQYKPPYYGGKSLLILLVIQNWRLCSSLNTHVEWRVEWPAEK